MAVSERLGFDDTDPITPSLIEHRVDEIIIDGQVEQVYNYIDYWFDASAGRVRARVYLDTAHEALIYPPMEVVPGKGAKMGEDWDTRDAVIRYLARRYLSIKELSLGSYKVVWMATYAPQVFEHRGISLED